MGGVGHVEAEEEEAARRGTGSGGEDGVAVDDGDVERSSWWLGGVGAEGDEEEEAAEQ